MTSTEHKTRHLAQSKGHALGLGSSGDYTEASLPWDPSIVSREPLHLSPPQSSMADFHWEQFPAPIPAVRTIQWK